ncbi:MAG: hypothetical protein WCE75_00785 [Terracidiphilus sp.]
MRALASALLLLSACACLAQTAASPALVERALAAELRSAEDTSHPMRYRLRKQSPRLTTTKEICESRDGDVARLVAVNDQPLSNADEQKEQARLDGLLADPSRQRHRKQSEEGDAAIVFKLLRMLPEAFLYQDAGLANGYGGKVERFTFKPNPRFQPPDLETKALTTMTGELWVDKAAERVTRLEGHLQQDTDYGWGILGKLDRGGSVVIEQASANGQDWRIARLVLRMNLRVLFKSKQIDTTEELTGYRPVPSGIDYREAIRLLRSQPGASAPGSR